MIDRVRTFAGYREYPKYAMVSRYFVYKQALLDEAETLVQAGVLRETEDIFYLRFQELRRRAHHVDDQLIDQRKGAFRSYRRSPPRVLTSDGEVVAGSYRRDDACRPVRWSACRSPPGSSRDGPRHPRPGGGSRPRNGRHPGPRTRTPAGRRCSSRSRAW